MHAFRPWARAASLLATGLLTVGLASAQVPARAPVQAPSAAASASAPGGRNAEELSYIESMIDAWPGMVISLPDKLPLDADMAATAKTLTAEVGPLMQAAGRRWL